MSRPTLDRLDAAPLVTAVEQKGGLGAGFKMGRRDSPHLRRAYDRAKAEGSLTWTMADVLAVQIMGRHPATIFGRAWWSL